MNGARWVQEEILEKKPAARMRVYAIWLPMIASDARGKWSNTLMTDARVVHLWDEKRVVGQWFAKHAVPSYPGDVAWDVYFLYDRAARWDGTAPPPVSWGRTIMKTREKLQADILPLLGD